MDKMKYIGFLHMRKSIHWPKAHIRLIDDFNTDPTRLSGIENEWMIYIVDHNACAQMCPNMQLLKKQIPYFLIYFPFILIFDLILPVNK